MEYVRLGWSGLKVSKICLGAMSFGDPALQPFGGGGWVSGKEEAFKFLNRAWDLGINFYDTANVYSRGKSEEILGGFCREEGRTRWWPQKCSSPWGTSQTTQGFQGSIF